MAAYGLHALAATDLVRLVSTRQLEGIEIAIELLERIEEREPSLQAWEFLDPGIAISQAMSDRRQGPLAGVPVGVKDLLRRSIPTRRIGRQEGHPADLRPLSQIGWCPWTSEPRRPVR